MPTVHRAPQLRWAFAYARPYIGRLSLVLVLSLTSTVSSLYVPYLSKDLVDVALIGRSFETLVRIVLVFTALTLTSFVLNATAGLTYTRASAEILFDMRVDLYRHLQRLSPRFYARTPLGQIVSRINADIGEIQRVMGEAMLAWLGQVVALVGTVSILLWLDWRLFFVSLTGSPFALWALVRYRRRLEVAVRAMRATSAEIGSFLIQSLRGMRIIVGFNAQEREVSRFRTANDEFIDALMSMRRLTYLSGGLPGLILAFGTSVVFLYGGWRVIAGLMTMGTLVAFVTYQMRLLSPVHGLMGLYTNLATARVSLERVAEILETEPEVSDPKKHITLDKVGGEVVFDRVTFGFGNDNMVLDNVSFSVPPGQTVAVVGRSGVGKSTMSDLLTRQVDPLEGAVYLDGRDLRLLRLHDIRSNITIIEQDPLLFGTTIGENIRFADPGADGDRVATAARNAGLGTFLDQHPDGLDTAVGEDGRALSAGERQRVAIARALLANPAVLVLDEATSSLDPQTELEVIDGYERVSQGRTTIIITHRLALARRADRVLVLDNGRIVEDGPPAQLMERQGPFVSAFAS